MFEKGDQILFEGKQYTVTVPGKGIVESFSDKDGVRYIIPKLIQIVNPKFRQLQVRALCISKHSCNYGKWGVVFAIIDDNTVKVMFDDDEIEVFRNDELKKC